VIKKALGGLLDSLAGLLEREVDPQSIRAYIEKRYGVFVEKHDIGEAVEQDLAAVQQIMITLGWLNGSQAAQENRKYPEIQGETEWFGKQGLVPGAGQALDQLDLQGERQVTNQILEKLLRHVEIKREKSLSKFVRSLSPDQIWIERCDVSILFSRVARRHHDLRFLNAALKMNEWYLRKIGNSRSVEVTARFLLALAEQELSAGEMLAC
jgi:hypothetical protein